MELKEIFEDIQSKAVVPLWPRVGMVLGMSRGSIYAATHRNEIDVTHVFEPSWPRLICNTNVL